MHVIEHVKEISRGERRRMGEEEEGTMAHAAPARDCPFSSKELALRGTRGLSTPSKTLPLVRIDRQRFVSLNSRLHHLKAISILA